MSKESPPAASTTVNFNLKGPTTIMASEGGISNKPAPNVIIDKEGRQPRNNMAKLLMLHHQYWHIISMRKRQEMAKQGILPKRLATYQPSSNMLCMPACCTRRPPDDHAWRGKTTSKVRQGQQQANKTRTSCFSGPTGITNARVDCTDDWIPHDKEVATSTLRTIAC
jgi:hypothetical protein